MQKFNLQPHSSRSLAGLQTLACQPCFLYFWIFSFITPLLLVVEVQNGKSTYRKSLAGNVLEVLGSTFDP